MKTADVLVQRRSSRQLEEIGEKAEETLTNSPIDAELLVKRDLDPMMLANHLLASRSSVIHHFSTVEIVL